jgi:AcrR family transcriptional regulator
MAPSWRLNGMGLREKKAARIKLNILDYTINRIGKRSFKDLVVDEICESVEISKVTLFKYFPKKGDILEYFMRVWVLRRLVELRKTPLFGLEAIRYLFQALAEDCERYPGLILSLVGYIASQNEPPSKQRISIEERKILFPEEDDLASIDILPIEQILLNYLIEAAKRGEIHPDKASISTVRLLITVFYGSALTAHMEDITKIRTVYLENLASVLNMIENQ